MFPTFDIACERYYTVYQWSLFTTDKIQHLFDSVDLFTSIGFTASDLYDYFYTTYESRTVSVGYIDTGKAEEDINTAINKMKKIISVHTLANRYKYEKLVASLSLEYNPIENYSMTEDGNDSRTKGNDTDSVTYNGNAVTTVDVPDITSETSVAPYDNETYKNERKNITKANKTLTTYTPVGSDTTKTYGDDTLTHHLTRKGNIGVTTTQQMIESERDIARFNVIEEYMEDINKYLLLSVW